LKQQSIALEPPGPEANAVIKGDSATSLYPGTHPVALKTEAPAAYRVPNTSSPSPVYFSPGSAVVGAADQLRLQEFAKSFSHDSDLVIELTSFTDATGNPATNRMLAEKRQAAVKTILIKNGITLNQVIGSYAVAAAGKEASSNQRKVTIRMLTTLGKSSD
jgi:outer membrane protein OmpA-like peptidoglycan-associated protein